MKNNSITTPPLGDGGDNVHSNGAVMELANGQASNGHATKSPFPIPVSEMRERYLKLYTGAVNDVLRFNYKMHATSLPATFAPLRESMKLAGLAFTVKEIGRASCRERV